jgi:8-oxo-dGTP pyrophosphatase MutT (NUDIX family)
MVSRGTPVSRSIDVRRSAVVGRIREATAGAFVFARIDAEWKLGLIEHPRLGRLMIPGGHVEDDEHCAQAAVREVAEETGLRVSLLAAPVAVPLPSGYPHRAVAAPWWITELDVPADNHTAEPHVHIDHQYVAVVTDTRPTSRPVHRFGWFSLAQVGEVAMFDDTRLLAMALFGCVDAVAIGDPEAVVAALARR